MFFFNEVLGYNKKAKTGDIVQTIFQDGGISISTSHGVSYKWWIEKKNQATNPW